MSDDDLDIRILALRRRQKRSESRATVQSFAESEPSIAYGKVRSGRSLYEAQSAKSYAPEMRTPRKTSFLSNMPVPVFEEDNRIGRMHVPPVVKCECNGIETNALISTSETVSTMSMELLERLRLLDQLIPEPSHVYNPLANSQSEVRGKVKYIDLALGSWQQVAQFNVVESSAADLVLGIDFLRKTQSIISFEDASLMVGGKKGERVPFLNTREIVALTRKKNKTNFETIE